MIMIMMTRYIVRNYVVRSNEHCDNSLRGEVDGSGNKYAT